MTQVRKPDLIDEQYQLKKFLKLIYRDLGEEEYIRVFQQKNDYRKVSYFNDIDDLVKYCTSKYVVFNNTYYTLATTNKDGGKKEDLLYRYCLAFDFDKKDYEEGFNHKTILNIFKNLKIHYHAMVDSGNGYHVYVMINKSNDFKKIQEVQQAIGIKVKADLNALKSTQLLRIPFTYNEKNGSKKMVRIICMEDRHKIRPYDIDFLYRKNCLAYLKNSEDTNIKWNLNNINIPKCIEDILIKGSTEGSRYDDLQKIVVAFRKRNKTLSEIQEICKEWAVKSNYDDNLEYRVKNIYDNLGYISMECKECQYKQKCSSVVLSDFEYNEDDIILTLSETQMSKLKHSNRKGAKTMKANDLLVYGVLKCHNDGLTREEILKELTYTKRKVVKNIALSERTLKDTIKSLSENGFIDIIRGVKRTGIPDMYRLKESGRSKAELTYNISFSATFECIKGNITPEELRLYNYMRYLHNKQQREKSGSLKGNLFQINQIDLAKELGVTQQRISVMINNLIDEKLIGIWYRQKSANNGFEYNIYRLNY